MSDLKGICERLDKTMADICRLSADGVIDQSLAANVNDKLFYIQARCVKVDADNNFDDGWKSWKEIKEVFDNGGGY